MTPEQLVAALSATPKDLKARLRSVDVGIDVGAKRLRGQFFYLPFKNGEPTVAELVDVAYRRMVDFAIPKKRIAAALQAATFGGTDALVELVDEARDLFIKTKNETGRSGELGEMLLFILSEWALSAPIVACKMYLKTSSQMPVHGTDGIHLGHDDGSLFLYWGESKLHKTLASAVTDVAESIAKQASDPSLRASEIRIVKANLNINDDDVELREALMKYFDPYAEESNQLRECYSCLIGFDYHMYESVKGLSAEEAEAKFREAYVGRIKTAMKLIVDKLDEFELEKYEFRFFLLPFPCVDSARALFQKKLGVGS